ncbi:MAG: Hpt domain-containing protein [Bryobacteraceae bacterium]|jgi:chemotaxis protein histidine kinase CheA
MEDTEIIKEFVIESSENLERLDREMVGLESRPDDADLLASVFRTVHTIKGTCGFLGFGTLEKITHHVENILAQLRSGERKLTPELVSLILDTVDAVRNRPDHRGSLLCRLVAGRGLAGMLPERSPRVCFQIDANRSIRCKRR